MVKPQLGRRARPADGSASQAIAAPGHAEVVQVEYDPAQVGYEQLLDVFFANHDPTQLNRQGPDVGTQSAPWFLPRRDPGTGARAAQEALQASGRHRRPAVTEIVPFSNFFRAEEYHQRYLEKRGLASCAMP